VAPKFLKNVKKSEKMAKKSEKTVKMWPHFLKKTVIKAKQDTQN